jgi:hypothetical protein
VDEQRIDGFPAGPFKGFYGSKLQSHLGEIKWRDWFATFQGRDLGFLSLMLEKYDKSQEETMLEAQLKIMHFFDIPKWIVGTWRSMVCSSRCSMGVSLSVGFQRRTGDAFTWVGNTIVLITLLAELYPIEKSLCVLLEVMIMSHVFLWTLCWKTKVVRRRRNTIWRSKRF